MIFEIRYKKDAIKALARINNPYYESILKAIENLALNPRPLGCKKLTGRVGFRIRVGTYRIIYDIVDNALIIEIINIGVRGNVYE
ncbi:MAG: type II toxin-antitoxin system RelE/ParE family toxin [Bacteroidetes bacterium]|nr:MAG: type II toxin-antitoxin system RelE/ParE family toxin [Bacteroidota bacterium]